MIASTLLSLLTSVAPTALASAPLPLPSAGAPTTLARQDEEKPDKRPEIKEMLDTLKGHAGKRGKQDQEAIQVIDTLNTEFENCGEKDRKSIVKGIAACLKQKRTESKEGIFDNKLYLAAAVSLGNMGPESAKPIIGWIDHKQHRKDLLLQRNLILSLGKTQAKEGIEPLLDLLSNKDAAVQGAAAEALGGYQSLDQKQRKDVFVSILKEITALKGQVDTDPTNTIARERYDVIKAPMITSLQVLSGHDERNPEAWQRWWNKNKKKDWDKDA
jgi:HEAT repeat protein